MRIFAAVQAIFALAFTLLGLVTLFGIGIGVLAVVMDWRTLKNASWFS